MRGITIIFGNESVHTGNDLDLVQEKKDIGKPTIQSFTAQVPGRNGLLNLTRSLTGKVNYYNRPLSFQYFGTGNHSQLLDLDAYFSRFHGQTIQIVDDDHPDHYYEGEATVKTTSNPNYITISLEVDAQPFRLKRSPTIVTRTVNGTETIYLDNEYIEAVPIITTTGEIELTFNGVTTHLSAGSYSITTFILQNGVNKVEISGSATVTIQYQEGAI